MAVAVICEFNPFHNGHKYLLQKAKQATNEPVIAVMSGSFTQRGEVAVFDKFTRARAALQNGADLVLELPCVYAVSNAQRFAFAGVEIASAFNCTDTLAFGCETDDIDLLLSAARAAQNEDVQAVIKREMKNGGYYPRAFECAVKEVLGDKTADILKSPNNVLAVEYLRSLFERYEKGGVNEKTINPLPIKRIGAEHDSSTPCGGTASASYIREVLRNGGDVGEYMPLQQSDITYPENLERATLYRLRAMSVSELAALPDVGEGLENRIYTAVGKNNSVKEIIDYIKTKRYTHARIHRIITCALLGITSQMQNLPIDYVRVLGFTDDGAQLLKHCRKSVVTSAASGLRLDGNTAKLLEKDVFATDIAALAYNIPKSRGLDFTTPVIL